MGLSRNVKNHNMNDLTVTIFSVSGRFVKKPKKNKKKKKTVLDEEEPTAVAHWPQKCFPPEVEAEVTRLCVFCVLFFSPECDGI